MDFVVSLPDWDYHGKKCPIKGAKKRPLTRLDWRTWKSIEAAKASPYGMDWYEENINHREVEGGVVAENPKKEKIWVLSIDTPEQLGELSLKYNGIEIHKSTYKEIQHHLVLGFMEH